MTYEKTCAYCGRTFRKKKDERAASFQSRKTCSLSCARRMSVQNRNGYHKNPLHPSVEKVSCSSKPDEKLIVAMRRLMDLL